MALESKQRNRSSPRTSPLLCPHLAQNKMGTRLPPQLPLKLHLLLHTEVSRDYIRTLRIKLITDAHYIVRLQNLWHLFCSEKKKEDCCNIY